MGPEPKYNCYTDKINNKLAVGNIRLASNATSSETSFFCEKPEGEPVEGTLNFKANAGHQVIPKVVIMKAASRKVELESAEVVESAWKMLRLECRIELMS